MTKNNKRDELIDELVRWAEEDNENRSVLVLAADKRDTRLACNGTGVNLANALANALLQEDKLRSVCDCAMLLYRNNKENDDDEARPN